MLATCLPCVYPEDRKALSVVVPRQLIRSDEVQALHTAVQTLDSESPLEGCRRLSSPQSLPPEHLGIRTPHPVLQGAAMHVCQ